MTHLQADCQELGSAPEPYAEQSSIGYLYLYTYIVIFKWSVTAKLHLMTVIDLINGSWCLLPDDPSASLPPHSSLPCIDGCIWQHCPCDALAASSSRSLHISKLSAISRYAVKVRAVVCPNCVVIASLTYYYFRLLSISHAPISPILTQPIPVSGTSSIGSIDSYSHYPSPPDSFIPSLKPSFSANLFRHSLLFFFRTDSTDSLDCLPIILSILVFLLYSSLFSLFNFWFHAED